MNYIVLDLEWNQPRWYGETVEKPVHLVGEIVQIGAVRMNPRLSIKEELRLTVKAKYYRSIHKKVAKITGLDNNDLRQGLSFPEAYKKLVDFCGKDFIFLTWGPDDVAMLRDNLILYSLDEDWLPKWYDLQVIFSHQKTGTVRQFALEDAIEMLGEEPFRAHDALADAKSTALICRHLDMKKGFLEYARLCNDITSHPLVMGETGISWKTRGEALEELSRAPFPCPSCDDYIEPGRTVPQNANKFLAPGECSCGNRYLIRFRLYHSDKDRFRAIREVYAMDEILEDFYREKSEKWEKQKELNREKERKKRARRRLAKRTVPANHE